MLIELSKSKHTGVFTKIDDKYSDLDNANWSLTAYGYAVTRIAGNLVLLHRAILGLEQGYALSNKQHVDHINGDRLDNRVANLRICTQAENNKNVAIRSTNTSGLKGVSPISSTGLWRASISIEGKTRNLGHFATKELAYEAYCRAVDLYHKEYGNYG